MDAGLITVISSIVAIAAVTICSLVTAIINQRGAKNIKHTELLFHEKVQTYYDFFEIVNQPTLKSVDYATIFYKALMLSSPKTQQVLRDYRDNFYAYREDANNLNKSLLAKSTTVLIDAMQKELNQ